MTVLGLRPQVRENPVTTATVTAAKPAPPSPAQIERATTLAAKLLAAHDDRADRKPGPLQRSAGPSQSPRRAAATGSS